MGSILFVCTGNICRSPSAEGIFSFLSEAKGLDIHFDSAGTHAYHVGEAPDQRSQAHALDRGFDISHLRARQVSKNDFYDFDNILVMDASHYTTLLAMKPDDCRADIKYLMEYAPLPRDRDTTQMDIPDPYYGGPAAFEYVLDLIELAAEGFFDQMMNTTTRLTPHAPFPASTHI